MLDERSAARFWSHVAIGGPDECWEWQAVRNERRGGYGQFMVKRNGKKRMYRAHRAAFILATGEDPGALFVLHTCDNPPCCNPNHLRAGTPAQNTQDMINKGRYPRSKDGKCANGHLWSEHAYIYKGKRNCRACRTAYMREWKKRQRDG